MFTHSAVMGHADLIRRLGSSIDPLVGSLDGIQAIRRRDALERAFVFRLPAKLQLHASGALTRMTGLAPSHRANAPVWHDSALREAVLMLVTFIVGAILVLQPHHYFLRSVGCLMVISAMRNLTSGTGHQLSHDPAKLLAKSQEDGHSDKDGSDVQNLTRQRHMEKGRRITKFGYNGLSAIVLLPSLAAYWEAHRRHHFHVSGPKDPDTCFLGHLGFYVGGLIAFVRTILNPLVHLKFTAVRLKSFRSEPAWRYMLALLSFVGPWCISAGTGVVWVVTLTIGYQIAALVAFTTLHHWNPTIEGKPTDVASEITLGRLVLPEPTVGGFAALVIGATLAAICWPTDKSHDVHHLSWEGGKWFSVPYVRTRLIMEGRSLRQTGSTLAMFKAAFDAAKRSGMGQHSILDEDDFLAM